MLEGDLNFHAENSGYASHDVHAFAAKFPPQLPKAFIQALTRPGDTVLDPMMGSGTVVVEAMLEGRRGIGLDIDPLALRLSQVKSMISDIEYLQTAAHRALARVELFLSRPLLIESSLSDRFSSDTRAFIDYWFLPGTQRELMAIVLAIEEESDILVRRFLELTFSSIIVTKSGGVSRARDLAHSRPHLVESKIPRHAPEQFAKRLNKNLASMSGLPARGAISGPIAGDARALPLADEVADLIVTSPPYANAIDYMRAHKFSLVWLGMSVDHLARLRAQYIGSERIGRPRYGTLPSQCAAIIAELSERDSGKAKILGKYFAEMTTVLIEMRRVLRRGSAAVVVVGTSNMRGINVQTHQCLADIASEVGFEIVKVARRALDRNKRMMPARFGGQPGSMIEQRMHEEYVLGLFKPYERVERGTR